MKNLILIILALGASGYIGYSDLHQTDTGITVAALLVAGFIFGILANKKLWLYGIGLGVGVPLAQFIAASRHMLLSGTESGGMKYWPASYQTAAISLVSIVIAIVGVYIGYGIKGLFRPKKVY